MNAPRSNAPRRACPPTVPVLAGEDGAAVILLPMSSPEERGAVARRLSEGHTGPAPHEARFTLADLQRLAPLRLLGGSGPVAQHRGDGAATAPVGTVSGAGDDTRTRPRARAN